MLVPATSNDRWSLAFVSDQLTDGRRFRILPVVDDCTRECLTLVADTSLSGVQVAQELDRLTIERGNPRSLVQVFAPPFRRGNRSRAKPSPATG